MREASASRPYDPQLKVYLAPKPIHLDDASTDGPSDAPVTIVLFGEFGEPYPARLANTLKEIRLKYQGKIRFAFRDYMVFPHNGLKPAIASLAAQRQGRYLEYSE